MSLGPPSKFTDLPKPQPFKKEDSPLSTTTIEDISNNVKNLDEKEKQHTQQIPIISSRPIIRKSDKPELRKLKISRPSFDPTEGIDFENFASKKEAFLMGYLNALYHRLDGVKKVK